MYEVLSQSAWICAVCNKMSFKDIFEDVVGLNFLQTGLLPLGMSSGNLEYRNTGRSLKEFINMDMPE